MKLRLNAQLLLILSLCLPLRLWCQEYSSSFNTLRLPASSHVAALGGQNISLIEDSPAAGWSNPALYANASDLSFGLDFMTYYAGSTWMGAHFTKAFGERHTLAVHAQYMNYGEMDETDETGTQIGSFRPKDIIIGAGYSYLLSDHWTGGANLKMISSNLAGYNALALSVDLGINYLDEEKDLSVSAVLQNVGMQIKSYDGESVAHLPFTLALGFSKGLEHLPVRFHVMMTDVTRWKSSFYALPNADTESVSFGKKALNHFIVGLDILPTNYLYLSLGYNFRRAYELKASGSSHLAGLSAGGGVNIKKVKFGVSFAKYHQAGGSLMIDAGFHL